MCSHVLLHVALLGECTPTHNALERLLTSVGAHVLPQVKILAELLAAVVTFVLCLLGYREEEDVSGFVLLDCS